MAKTRKTIELRVTVSCPTWLSRRQAKKEVRALINDQCFYGHRKPGTFDEIDDHNFRARKVE
jgi:predicted secreted Zn-dependent protease